MKHITVAAIVATAIVWPQAFAAKVTQAKEFFIDSAKAVLTKQEATKKLILFRDQEIYRCQLVELSESLTIRRKK